MNADDDSLTLLEARLRGTLTSVAEEVTTSPGAYRRVQASWRRRERRRRLLVLVLSTLIIGGADVVGLWALNDTPAHTPVIFRSPGPTGP